MNKIRYRIPTETDNGYKLPIQSPKQIDLEEIKDILNTGLSEDDKRILILKTIAKSPGAIPSILAMLDSEREQCRDLISDSNEELSRAFVVLKDENVKANKNALADPKWVADQIKCHYKKWSGVVTCNYPIDI